MAGVSVSGDMRHAKLLPEDSLVEVKEEVSRVYCFPELFLL